MKKYFFYEVPVIGRIALCSEEGYLTEFRFEHSSGKLSGVNIEETSVHREAHKQLKEYLSGSRKEFGLPLAPKGTEFQLKVWRELMAIPYGETRAYGQIALAVDNPKASRAVGLANNRNPLALFIPCHRVIGSDGRLVGYGGGLHIKEYVLELEHRHVSS